MEKLGQQVSAPDPENQAIRRGIALEPVVASEVARLRPDWKIEKYAEYFRDPEGHIGATPDYLVTTPEGRRGAMQTKTIAASKFKKLWLASGEDFNDDDESRPDPGILINPPFWIVLQTLQEAMLTASDFGVVAVLVLDSYVFETHVIEFERNAGAEFKIQEAVAHFWQKIAAGEQPTVDPTRDADIVRMMYPRTIPDKVVDLRGNNRVLELLDERELVVAQLATAKERKKALDTEFKAMLGDAEVALIRGWIATNKTQTRKAHVVKESTFTVLRVKREND